MKNFYLLVILRFANFDRQTKNLKIDTSKAEQESPSQYYSTGDVSKVEQGATLNMTLSRRHFEMRVLDGLMKNR